MPKEVKSAKTKETKPKEKAISPTKPVLGTKKTETKSETRLIEFEIFSPASNIVEIAGTFNDWTPSKLPLKRDKNGVWKGKINLAPGRHEYKVVFDGSSWELDPKREAIATNLGANNLLIIE